MNRTDSLEPNYYSPFRLHLRGQPKGDHGEGDENDQPDEIGQDERHHALENGRETHVLHDALDHEDVHAHRWMDEAQFDRHDDDDAEPDRVEAEVGDDREDDRHGQDDHRHGIHQAAEHKIHQHDERQHAVGAQAEARQEGGHLLRGLRDGQEIAEDQGANQHREHG